MATRRKKKDTEIGMGAVSLELPFPPAPASAPMTLPEGGNLQAATQLNSNLKGLSGDITLGPLTAVVGENRGRKTAVRLAYEMALTGRVPGATHAKDFLELAPPGADSVSAMLLAPHGSAMYEVRVGVKPPESPEYYGGFSSLNDPAARVAALPSVGMRALLAGDTRTRRAVFERYGRDVLGAGVPTPNGLTADQQRRWQQIHDEAASTTVDVAGTLSEMHRLFAAEKTKLGREIAAEQRALEERQANLVVQAAGAEYLRVLEAEYDRARKFEVFETTRTLYAQSLAELANCEREAHEFLLEFDTFERDEHRLHDLTLPALTLNAQETTTTCNAARAELQALQTRLARLVALSEILDAMVAADTRRFPILDVEVDVAACRARLDEAVAERRKEIEPLQARVAEAEAICTRLEQTRTEALRVVEARRQALAARRTELKTRGGEIERRIADLDKALATSPQNIPRPSVEVTREILQVRAAAAAAAQLVEVETSLRQKRNAQALAKVLEGEASELLQRLLRTVKTQAETGVNKYMPAGFVAQLDLSGDGCQWTVIGVDGRAHGFTMCGAEKASLLVALALAWTEGAPYRALTLDDEDIGPFHSSPANLRAFLQRLAEAVENKLLAQVIVCGIRLDEVPAGWTIVRQS